MGEKKEDKTLTSAKPRAVAKKLFTPMMKEWQPVSPKMPARPTVEENPSAQSETEGVFAGALQKDSDALSHLSEEGSGDSKEVFSETTEETDVLEEVFSEKTERIDVVEEADDDQEMVSALKSDFTEEDRLSEDGAVWEDDAEDTISKDTEFEAEADGYRNSEYEESKTEAEEAVNSEYEESETEAEENVNSEYEEFETEAEEAVNSEYEESETEAEEVVNSEYEESETEAEEAVNSEYEESETEADEDINSEYEESETEAEEDINSEYEESEAEADEDVNSEYEESEMNGHVNPEFEVSSYQEDTENTFSEEAEDPMPEALEPINEEPHSRVALSDNKSGMGMGWYVVHTYSGYENKVKANIEKAIENRHLENEILEVRVPLQEVMEVKNGVEKSTQKKLFPGYVLLHMDADNNDAWYVVRNTRGVTGFVGPGSKPVPLTEEELRALDFGNEVALEYAEGDVIHVIAGVWKDTVGTIQKIDAGRQTVTINVEMFGRETPVEIHFSDIKKMWD